MGLDNIGTISDEYGEEALGAEGGVTITLKADDEAPKVDAQGVEVPVHPVLDDNENEEQVLGI